jgi:two-component system sensor histidine kinase YesM
LIKRVNITPKFFYQIIQEGLLDYDKLSLEEKVNTEKVFEKLFLQEQSSKSNMAYINIFSLEGQPLFFSLNVYYNKKDVTDEVWYKRICSTEGETVITNTYKDNLGNDVISIIRKINNVLQYTTTVGRPVGYLMISYYETLLESTYKNVNFGDGGNFYIIDKNNIIISNKDKSLLGKKLDAEIWSKLPNGQEPVIRTFYGDRYLVFNHAAQNTDWRLVGILPLREVFSWNKNIFIHNLYILILSFFISLFMAFTFSSRISIPIAALRDKMKQVEAGAFPESISVKSGDEIEELAKSFNSMVKKLKELIEEVYQAEITRQKAEIRQKEAELNTLQAQINPHFLYNTLETINWIAIELLGHDNDISNTVLALSSLLRSTITRGDKIVPVEKQLKEVEEYLFIQKMRYEDKFTVRWNIDQGILQYKMLSMVIQPIVENAIVHGIENIESGGEIVIKGWEHDGDLFFEISDNGVGMDKEKLEEIRKMIDYEESMPSGSIGLRNTHQRLRHYYGENYGLKIDRDTGGWTKVTICAPAVIEHS